MQILQFFKILKKYSIFFHFFLSIFFLKYILLHFLNLQNKSPKKGKKKKVELGVGFEHVTPSLSVFQSPSLPLSLMDEKKKIYI